MTIHCKSGDDDLGERQLPVGSAAYEWSFKINLTGTTEFWCDFSFPPDLGGSFNVFYVDTPLTTDCYEFCDWRARNEGLFVYDQNSGKQWVKLYDWKKI
ncbi:hypothetical protein SLA2020_290250 [Shorea laevis]